MTEEAAVSLVEKMADAYRARVHRGGSGACGGMHAALKALDEAGFAVVPKEATDAEWDAAWKTLQANNWLTLRQHISVHHARTFFQVVRRAMLAAAPEVT